MLKQRLITAILMVPFILWGIYALSTYHLSLVLTAIMVMLAWEWSALMGLDGSLGRGIYVLIQGMLLPYSMQLFDLFPFPLLGFTLLWWFFAMFWIGQSKGELVLVGTKDIVLLGMVGLVVLQPMWVSLLALHGNGPFGVLLFLYLMFLIWGADSGAYFAGRRWGRNRLAVHVSPGKTWEGVFGALAMTLLLALGGVWWFGFHGSNAIGFILLSVVTVMFSIVGDLWESLVKRRRGVKDSGQILPGHGGLLDRLDSLTAAAPIFSLGLMLQGVIQ